jgi:hypothetical protein
MEKRLIDKKRESGGAINVGSIEDGAIEELINIGGRMFVIKGKSIYETVFAASIDPGRTNINLPNTINKLIINQGVDSEIVDRTFLTAKTLFQRAFFDQTIDTDKALTLSLDMLHELAALKNEINDYLVQEQRVIREYEDKKGTTHSYSIPSITDTETRCKTIFQKADHVEQFLMEIITLFYPCEGLKKQSHFPKFFEVIKMKYGEKDLFVEFVKGALDFMVLVRELRNALDHRLEFVKVRDFEIQPDSSILSPTIELKNRYSTLTRVALFSFLPIVLKNLIFIFEGTVAYISNKKGKGVMRKVVREIPEDSRRYKFVRYSFWSPIGEGGFYHQ